MMNDDQHPLMPYLHVPIQSGCDKILGLMKRKYTLQQMEEFFTEAIETIPGVCIGTDMMTGYPGESESDFNKTCETFLTFPFSYCHVFTYSERDGTAAERSGDHIPMQERRSRSSHLRQLSASKRLDWHAEFQGKKLRVLLENPKNGYYSGYTDNYLKVLIPIEKERLENKFVRVRVGEARPEYCLGQIINVET